MDINFSNLKKEAAATGEEIFGGTAAAVKQTAADITDDLLGIVNSSVGSDGSGGGVSTPGKQDDNSHTEHYFANEQKDLATFDHDDPQAFVQRMSAGAKEAQEQLDAKFAQQTNDIDDFLSQATKELGSFGKQSGISDITNDFMNSERGLFGRTNEPLTGQSTSYGRHDAVEDLLGGFNDPIPTQAQTHAPTAPPSFGMFHDDDLAVRSSASNKDSDTDSTSVSCNPSPAKKLPVVTDILKEQDNEKFISSEDLLSDCREEEPVEAVNLKPAPVVASSSSSISTSTAGSKSSAVPVTDLDDDFADFKAKPSTYRQAEDIMPAPKPSKVEPAARPQQPPPAVPEHKAPLSPAATSSASSATVAKERKVHDIDHPKIVSVEEIFYKYGLDAWFKPERLHPQVESLIYWRDVKKSGIVFGAGFLILLAISCFSVISVFAYVSLLTLAGTIAFRIYKSVMQAIQKTTDGHPFKEYLDIDLTLSQEKVQNIAGVAVAHINGCISELRRLFLVDDLIDSIKFGGLLWVLTYVGAWFNGMTLVILAFVSLFTLPKVYENNKQSIDSYLDLVRSKLAEVTDKIKVALPIGNKKPVAAETDKDK